MRRLMGLLAASLLSVAAITVSGCSKDDPADPYGGGNQTVLSGTIDGSAWTASAPLASRSTLSTPTTVSVFGSDAQGREVQVTVTGVSGPGTFSAGNNQAAVVTLELGSQIWPGFLAGSTGSVVITAFTSTYMTGTFNVTLVPQTSTGASGNKTVVGTFTAYFGQT